MAKVKDIFTVPSFLVIVLPVNFLEVPKSMTFRFESFSLDTKIMFSGLRSR